MKTKEELKTINDKNLLRYYKAERKRFYGAFGNYMCSCGCGEYFWDLGLAKYEEEKKQHDEHQAYLEFIKEELNIRGHVEPEKKKTNDISRHIPRGFRHNKSKQG